MRVMGIDPGLRRTGWGVIEASDGRMRHLGNGHCDSEGQDLSERLGSLFVQLTEIVEEFRPHRASVEKSFVSENALAALKLGHARAVALLVPSLAGLPVAEYSPNSVKKAVVGRGHAEKSQIEAFLRMQFPAADIAGSDAADALGIALADLLQQQYSSSLGAAVARAMA